MNGILLIGIGRWGANYLRLLRSQREAKATTSCTSPHRALPTGFGTNSPVKTSATPAAPVVVQPRMHRSREIFRRRASLSSHLDQDGRIPRRRSSGLDKSAIIGHQSLRRLESLVQIVPRSACGALDEIATDPIRNRRIKLTAYEHTRTYRYHVDRARIPLPRSGLELYHDSWLHRERFFLDAFFCPMACLRAAGRKRHPDIVLVLEHRRQCDHVFVLYFQTGSDRHPRLSAKLPYLHSQFDADSEAPVCPDRSRALSAPARNGLDCAINECQSHRPSRVILQRANALLSNPWPCGSGSGRWDDRKR